MKGDDARRRRLAAATGQASTYCSCTAAGVSLASCRLLVQASLHREGQQRACAYRISTHIPELQRGRQCREHWLARSAAHSPGTARQCTAGLAAVLAAGWLPLQIATVQSALSPICLSGVTKAPLFPGAEGLHGWCLWCALHAWWGVGCTETKQLKEGEQEGLEKSTCQEEGSHAGGRRLLSKKEGAQSCCRWPPTEMPQAAGWRANSCCCCSCRVHVSACIDDLGQGLDVDIEPLLQRRQAGGQAMQGVPVSTLQ